MPSFFIIIYMSIINYIVDAFCRQSFWTSLNRQHGYMVDSRVALAVNTANNIYQPSLVCKNYKPGPPCFARSTNSCDQSVSLNVTCKDAGKSQCDSAYWDWGRSLSLFANTTLHNTVPIVDTKILAFALWVPFLNTTTKHPLAFLLGRYLIATNAGGYL